jgi:hypothetical protein
VKGHRKPARQVDFYANFRVKAFLSNSRLAESIIKLNFQYQFGYTIVQYFSTPPSNSQQTSKEMSSGSGGNST